MQKLIDLLPTPELKAKHNNLLAKVTKPEDLVYMLDSLYEDLWPVQTQPGNNYGPGHPWHYPSAVAGTASKTLKSLLRHPNYALSINIPGSQTTYNYQELVEAWEDKLIGTPDLINFIIDFAHDWDILAILEDAGDDDGGPFGTLYFIKRGFNVYDLIYNTGQSPDEAIWFPKGLLGIPWMYQNAPDKISSITHHPL